MSSARDVFHRRKASEEEHGAKAAWNECTDSTLPYKKSSCALPAATKACTYTSADVSAFTADYRVDVNRNATMK
jgi:hypothetical protein